MDEHIAVLFVERKFRVYIAHPDPCKHPLGRGVRTHEAECTHQKSDGVHRLHGKRIVGMNGQKPNPCARDRPCLGKRRYIQGLWDLRKGERGRKSVVDNLCIGVVKDHVRPILRPKFVYRLSDCRVGLISPYLASRVVRGVNQHDPGLFFHQSTGIFKRRDEWGRECLGFEMQPKRFGIERVLREVRRKYPHCFALVCKRTKGYDKASGGPGHNGHVRPLEGDARLSF
jgi:hypothetical protein